MGSLIGEVVLRFGDGAQLLQQPEQVYLEPVLLHLAVHHKVDLDARAGRVLVGPTTISHLGSVDETEEMWGREILASLISE